ncbi:AsmA family protein [Sphingomonas sp.]|uniref:AsmA family protein n=1 Tax=Sphingomonas sp. TaxID=28214 RepID=UPI003B00CADE
MSAEPGAVETRRQRARPLRPLLRILAALLGIVVLAWLILFLTRGRFLRHPFERLAGAALHRSVTVGGDFQLYFAPLDIRLVAERLAISNPAWAGGRALFTARRIDTRIATLPLLFGNRRMRTLELVDGVGDLEWTPDHSANSWTFSTKKSGKPFRFPVIDQATVSGTILHYRDPRMRLAVDARFETIRSRDARIGRAIRLTGGGRIRDTGFTLQGALLSPDATVARGRNRLELRARTRHDVVDLRATLPSLAEIEHVPLAVAARGRNLAELLDVIGVVVPDTRRYALTAQLVVDGIDYRFTRLRGTFGDSDLAGAFTVRAAERTHIAADLATRRLAIEDAAPFIGYNPDVVAAGAVPKVGGVPRLLPDTPLRIEALRAFDADVRWRVGVVRSRNVPLSDIALTLALKDSRLRLSPLTFSMSRGRVASDVTIDARRHPVHAVADVRLAPTPVGRLLSGFGVIEAGTTGTVHGRLHLEGDGDSLHRWLAAADGRMALIVPQGTFWMRNVQLAELDVGVFLQRLLQGKLKEPVRVNCGLVAFTVRDGVAAADPILIDTTKNVIVGRGGFRFRDESLDLLFRGEGKKFSLFSGQSPIGLKGYLGAPRMVLVSRPLALRAGAGLALGILAPPAALLAFVDPGLAKSAACGPVLAGAHAAAQTTKGGDARSDVGTGTPSTAAKPRKKFLGIF